MKRYINLSFLISLCLLFFVMSCRQRSTDEVQIGVILPLTGDAAVYGKSLQSGIELALSNINNNENYKYQYRLSYEDSRAEPKEAVSAYQKLTATKNVSSIIGPFTSSNVLSVAPQAERDNIVILSPGASAPDVTNAGDYIFRIVTSDLYDGKVMADFSYSSLGLTKIAIFYINNDYGIGVRNSFRNHLLSLSGTVVEEQTFEKGDVDFRTQLTKIKSVSPDAIFIVGYKEMGRIVKQSRELNITAQLLSIGLFEDPEILSIAGDAAEGVFYSLTSYNPESERSEISQFVTLYKEANGNAPDIIAGLGYDALNILVTAIEKINLTARSIKDALYEIKNFPGVTGETSFDENGDVNKPFGIKKVENAQFVWHMKEYTVQESQSSN